MHYFFAHSFAIFLLSGCCTTTYTRDINKGLIQNSEIISTAVDKSFRYEGESTPPFHSSTPYNSLQMTDKDLLKAYQNALHHGAKHVRVKVPGKEEALYGVLALDKADKDGVGPGTQSYKVVVPKPYIDAAKKENISVVYEYYKLKNDSFIDVSDIKERSCILWISDKSVFK
ncbi:MAG TPA: hypothetical protein EYO73_03280 [Sulfurimonas sp.]|nr:hypothetical protein [Sulfurimonas sp.]